MHVQACVAPQSKDDDDEDSSAVRRPQGELCYRSSPAPCACECERVGGACIWVLSVPTQRCLKRDERNLAHEHTGRRHQHVRAGARCRERAPSGAFREISCGCEGFGHCGCSPCGRVIIRLLVRGRAADCARAHHGLDGGVTFSARVHNLIDERFAEHQPCGNGRCECNGDSRRSSFTPT